MFDVCGVEGGLTPVDWLVLADHAPAAEDKSSARYQARDFGAIIGQMLRA